MSNAPTVLIFASFVKGGYVFGSVLLSICFLFVCLSVREQHSSTSYKRIAMKFYGEAGDGTRRTD